MTLPPLYQKKQFLESLFVSHAEEAYHSTPLTDLLCGEFIGRCQQFDRSQLQDSWSWRNVHIGRQLAKLILDEKGYFDKKNLFKAIQFLEIMGHSLGPGRHHDITRTTHLLNLLPLFYKEPFWEKALLRIRKPEGNPHAEKIIRETLLLTPGMLLTDGLTRQAVLSALLTQLRQNVGSCFATAPAILIQQEQPEHFLEDMGQLLGTGRLNRTLAGVEHTVPLSFSWGQGDLVRPLSLASLGKNSLNSLACSPGLQRAFAQAGLLSEGEKGEESCLRFLKNIERELPPLITADLLIRRVLLSYFQLSEKEIYEQEKPTFLAGFARESVIHTVQSSQKELQTQKFKSSYEAAKVAFKSLTENALLKSWEFTLASLSESKSDYAKWNLFVSLGVQPEEPHGIGKAIYNQIQEKITELNQEIEAAQSKYDHLFAQVKTLEGRLTRGGERETEWLRADYQMRIHEINRVVQERDEFYEKGQRLTHLYPFLIDFYGKKIFEYFQEVYDSEMHDVKGSPFDDSPAGFRLLYKHGRKNPALWTLVLNSDQYINYLSAFFISTEVELNQLPEIKGLQKEVGEWINLIIREIKIPEFLEHSFYRLSRAYREPLIKHPLENLDQVPRKPWSYISGGTMSTLIQSYYLSPGPPKEVKRWVENEKELLAFLIDSLKEAPLSVQKIYQQNPSRSLLAFSPTHAFLCKPGWSFFRQGWESTLYTYTWIRDKWLQQQEDFLHSINLDYSQIEWLKNRLVQGFPAEYRFWSEKALKNLNGPLRPTEFREGVLQAFSYEKWVHSLGALAEEVDSLLFSSLPFYKEYELKESLAFLLREMPEIDKELERALLTLFESIETTVGKHQVYTADDLRNLLKGLLIKVLGKTRTTLPFHQRITQTMQRIGLSYPAPFLFADTNWVKNMFGFVVNPGSGVLELWRFDDCGSEGRPLSVWKPYLNGTSQQEWGLYNSPLQYNQN